MGDPAVTTPAASRRLAKGARLGRYEILNWLAAGGMAELYLARARAGEGFEKLVAIKLVLPHLARDPHFIGMFVDEAKLAATLDHPNLVQVIDAGWAGEDYFFAMEYLHGQSLDAVLRAQRTRQSQGRLPLPCALHVISGVAAGLHYAHERVGPDGRPLELVHRDVSPSNVFVTYDGNVKMVDFGVAKARAQNTRTRVGTLKGKRGYMSPEQCRGGAVDRRSDVFGIGVLLYELTTGRRPFSGDSDYAVMSDIVFGNYPRPTTVVEDFPAELEAILGKALAVDPDQRYPTAQDLLVDLERFVRMQDLWASAVDLAKLMGDLFEQTPYPWTPGEGELPDESQSFRVEAGARLVRAVPFVFVVVMLGLAVAYMGSFFADTTNSVESESAMPEVVEPEKVQATAPAAGQPIPSSKRAHDNTVKAPPTAEPNSPAKVSRPQTAKSRKRIRRKSKSSSNTAPAAADRPNSLFPPRRKSQ